MNNQKREKEKLRKLREHRSFQQKGCKSINKKKNLVKILQETIKMERLKAFQWNTKVCQETFYKENFNFSNFH